MKRKFNIKSNIATIVMVIGLFVLLGSCKYEKIAPASYPDQKIYMSTADVANLGSNANGIYNVNTVAIPGQVYRYTVDLNNKKFTVPLGIIRAGVYLTGSFNVAVTVSTDTISKLITSGKLAAETKLLPATAYTLTNLVAVPDGAYSTPFPLIVDLNFLLSNPNTKYAIAVGISSTERAVNPSLATNIILIDTQFLFPTAGFTSAPDPTSIKLINFTNTSLNGVSYAWDFGYGNTSVLKSPSHTYAASGTYTVKLTTTGATGNAQAVTVSNLVTVN
jgi:PKD repeat protein